LPLKLMEVVVVVKDWEEVPAVNGEGGSWSYETNTQFRTLHYRCHRRSKTLHVKNTMLHVLSNTITTIYITKISHHCSGTQVILCGLQQLCSSLQACDTTPHFSVTWGLKWFCYSYVIQSGFW
jgi:hypothetical protein